MIALHKGRSLLVMLDRKHQQLTWQGAQERAALAAIVQEQAQCQSRLLAIQLQLNNSRMSGVTDRIRLFKMLRSQAVLLDEQRYLLVEAERLSEQRIGHQQRVDTCQKRVIEVGKKRYKVNRFIQQAHQKYLLHRERLIENEIQESAVYGQH